MRGKRPLDYQSGSLADHDDLLLIASSASGAVVGQVVVATVDLK